MTESWDQMMRDPRNREIYIERQKARLEGRELPKYIKRTAHDEDKKKKIIAALQKAIDDISAL